MGQISGMVGVSIDVSSTVNCLVEIDVKPISADVQNYKKLTFQAVAIAAPEPPAP